MISRPKTSFSCDFFIFEMCTFVAIFLINGSSARAPARAPDPWGELTYHTPPQVTVDPRGDAALGEVVVLRENLVILHVAKNVHKEGVKRAVT